MCLIFFLPRNLDYVTPVVLHLSVQLEKMVLPWELKGMKAEPVKHVSLREKLAEQVVFDPVLGKYRDGNQVRSAPIPPFCASPAWLPVTTFLILSNENASIFT